jgi:hypothetical protein
LELCLLKYNYFYTPTYIFNFFILLIHDKLIVKTIIKKAGCKKSNGMRYEPEFLLYCLRLQSTSTYEHLRPSGLLPLPDKSTIRRMLSATKPAFGLNDFTFDSIGDYLRNASTNECTRMLCFDELALS